MVMDFYQDLSDSREVIDPSRSSIKLSTFIILINYDLIL